VQDNGTQSETLLSAETQSERTSRVASWPPYKSLKEFIEAQKESRSRQSSQTRTCDTRTRSPRFICASRRLAFMHLVFKAQTGFTDFTT